jgi:hypothetical protein
MLKFPQATWIATFVEGVTDKGTGLPLFSEPVWFAYKVSGVMCSASVCEHCWSFEGWIHSQRRNRIDLSGLPENGFHEDHTTLVVILCTLQQSFPYRLLLFQCWGPLTFYIERFIPKLVPSKDTLRVRHRGTPSFDTPVVTGLGEGAVGVMEDYKLRDLRASHTLGRWWNWNT